MPTSASDDDAYYTVPLRDQRVFGAGIRRKRVLFVPEEAAAPAPAKRLRSGGDVADLYAAILEGRGGASAPPAPTEELCATCNLPLRPGHSATLAHQVSLTHSHPPSAIARDRKGLAFLRAHGYDPDARRGLGKEGEGILHPIKVREKKDTVGLGARLPVKNAAPKKVQKLGAKEVREKEEEARRRREGLQRMFYEREEVVKYLGELG
ncbi:uncharacterized protein K452DRAFT_221337 [Aplosporella prunicola CBS 121167]|uniref:G-patch domain-containing protein n=1 Tax=Aplosporella prunicola CBS 121167 TaxID=1176127 RepID=A0A6A6BQC0_9PEZI|nr:uncharacterized protein K452DRAFT_221337 [Aplosporella prunicola CBS 121167]KAF2145623.1 hypothetical protein K452DRAFT_221337 [Aplosporella prunicola CBS 121167]